MTDVDGNLNNGKLISTENVCGLIFDTKIVGGLTNALDTNDAAKYFANGTVIEVNSLKDAEGVGITEELMKGLPHYHVKQFFTLAGSNQRLFISFMDSTTDHEFEAIEKMQLASGGIIYQIGVWTSEPIATTNTDDNTGCYKVADDTLLHKLQAQAELLGGKVGITNYEGNSPLNVIVTAPVVDQAAVDYTKLPDLTSFNFQKVSVLIGQAASEKVHGIQAALNYDTENAGNCIVGAIGAMLGCFAIAPADESVAHVRNFNLVQVTNEAELGFGNLVAPEKGTDKEGNTVYTYPATAAFNNVKTMSYAKRNEKIHRKGYIFLTNYDGIENGVFFSSDNTLSTGDYRLIHRCRVMHKSRRVVRLALLPYVNQSMKIDSATGFLANDDIAELQNTIYNALDNNMVQPGTTTSQICGRQAIIDPEQDILANDELHVSYWLVPKGLASAIFVEEGFKSTVNA